MLGVSKKSTQSSATLDAFGVRSNGSSASREETKFELLLAITKLVYTLRSY